MRAAQINRPVLLMYKDTHFKPNRLFRFAVISTLFLASRFSHAYLPLVTDDTETEGAGGNQVELGFQRTKSELDGSSEVTQAFPLEYTRGLRDNIDVFGGIGFQRFNSVLAGSKEQGWVNPVVGFKWRLYENEAAKLSFAIKPEISLPLARRHEEQGLGSGAFSYAMNFILTQETSFGELHANLFAQHVDFDLAENLAVNRRNQLRLSVAPAWNLNDQWKLALDAGLVTNPDASQKARMGYVQVGGSYAPKEELELGLGALRFLSDGPTRADEITLGLTWRFK